MNDVKEYSAVHCVSPPGNDRDTTLAEYSPGKYFSDKDRKYFSLTFASLFGHNNASCLVFVEEYLLNVLLVLLEDDLPSLQVPVEEVPGLGGHHMCSLLIHNGLSYYCSKCRVGETELQLASHEIPDTFVN